MAAQKWTPANTEGFSSEDLEVINEAQLHLERDHPTLDPTTIADLLNNAWTPDADARQLQRTVERRLSQPTGAATF